jgi:hypothetical protein
MNTAKSDEKRSIPILVDVIKESDTFKTYFELPHIPVTEGNSYKS